MKNEWDVIGTSWALANVSVDELERVVSRSIEIQRSVPSVHHI